MGLGGEEKQGKGEKNGWWRRKAGEGRKEWKAGGNIRFNSRRCERLTLKIFLSLIAGVVNVGL